MRYDHDISALIKLFERTSTGNYLHNDLAKNKNMCDCKPLAEL